jgi:hypothetical protein
VSAGSAIEKLLDKIDADLADFLVFAGILDNNAKLLSYRVGKSSFSLPIERHDTLDVQIALMFSLIKQLEDISGAHKLTVTRFAKHDIFMFGNQDLHIFVITSPTADERVAKSLVDLVGTLSNGAANLENAITKATAGMPKRKEQTVAAAISPQTQSVRSEQSQVDRRGLVLHRSRPEAITLLQGYLLGLEPGCTIEDDIEGRFKIKAVEDDGRLSWPLLEKINTVFKDKLVIHHLGIDADGRVFARISTK